MKNDIFYCLVVRRRGREKWWGLQIFSPPLSKYNLSKLERKLEWKMGKTFGQNYLHLFNASGFFFFWLFLCNAWLFVFVFCFLFFSFFLSLVLLGGGFFFFSFFFLLNFNFYYFFKKTLLDDFLYYFLKCPLSSI